MDSKIIGVEELDLDSSIEITGGDWLDSGIGAMASLAIAAGIVAAPALLGAAAIVGAGVAAYNTL